MEISPTGSIYLIKSRILVENTDFGATFWDLLYPQAGYTQYAAQEIGNTLRLGPPQAPGPALWLAGLGGPGGCTSIDGGSPQYVYMHITSYACTIYDVYIK